MWVIAGEIGPCEGAMMVMSKKWLLRGMRNQMMSAVMPQLPKKIVSHYVGQWAYEPLPRPLRGMSVRAFAKFFNIKTEEAEKPLNEYKTIGDFFARRLKPSARPIQADRIHPCDGRITQSGKIFEGVLIQAKGIKYQLEEFLPQSPWVDGLEQGLFSTYYLSPKDYHRVHMPVDGKICWVKSFPGELWPVNFWSLKNIPGVFAKNERVAMGIETQQGRMILVMVGATNVGSMSFSFDESIRTNEQPLKNRRFLMEYDTPPQLNVGEELGVFHLGSTVVLLTESGVDWPMVEAQKVLMGQPLEG